MEAESRKIAQVVLVAAIVIAAGRAGYIVYDRYETRKADEQPKQEAPLKADYYVAPKKLYFYDLKSAQELTRQPVWVKIGYGYTYFPYDTTRKKANFAHEAGTLGPLQKLQITDVFMDRAPDSPGAQQVMARFELDGKPFAVQIGTKEGQEFKFYVNDVFLIEDPHQLYKHWPADVWQAIDRHEAVKGMNQLQAAFALGRVTGQSSGDGGSQTLTYPNGGKPVTITYRDDKAVEIKHGS